MTLYSWRVSYSLAYSYLFYIFSSEFPSLYVIIPFFLVILDFFRIKETVCWLTSISITYLIINTICFCERNGFFSILSLMNLAILFCLEPLTTLVFSLGISIYPYLLISVKYLFIVELLIPYFCISYGKRNR